MMPQRQDGTMRKRVAFGTDRAAALNPLLSFVEDWMQAPGGYVEHMHRGFQTVTLVFAGEVLSADTYGEKRILTAGDVQWITTGSGVLHAEMAEGEGEAHMIQLWLNLPADQKLCAPRFQTLAAAQVPTVERPGAKIRVIAGELDGVLGGAQAAIPAQVLDLRLEAGASLALPVASGQLGVVYVAAGEPVIGPHPARPGDVVHFSSKISEPLLLSCGQPCHLVLVSAAPLGEPVIVNGPFIMNTAAQIQQAYADFRDNSFGVPKR